MSKIVVSRDGEKSTHVISDKETTIGRHESMTLQLENQEVSRRHATIYREDDQLWVRDHQSANGTIYNENKLDPASLQRLSHGDRLTIGPFELVFELDSQAQVEPVSAPAAPTITAAPTDAMPEPLLGELPDTDTLVWKKGPKKLKVVDIVQETHDVKTFRMRHETLFSYKPGQAVTLRLEIDGKEYNKTYTVSSSPSRPHTLEITVKRVPGGVASNWLHDNIKFGDEIQLNGPPFGCFSCYETPFVCQKILLLGAGSGVTPLMSMSRWIVDTAADLDIVFLVSQRRPGDIIFRQELNQLAARHLDMRSYVTISSGHEGSEPWLGLTGRVSKEMLRMVAPDLNERHVYLCGPPRFMSAAVELLKEMEFPIDQLHTESFDPQRVGPGTEVNRSDASLPANTDRHPSPAPADAKQVGGSGESSGTDVAVADETVYEVEFCDSSKVGVTDGNKSILQVGEANGVELSYACREGWCGQCRVECENPDDVWVDPAASFSDLKPGEVLACSCYPRGKVKIKK